MASGEGVPVRPTAPPAAPDEGAMVTPGAQQAQEGPQGLEAQQLPTPIQGPPATIGRARSSRNRQRTGAWPAGGTPRVDPNSLESVADDVAYWIESTAQEVAGAMMDGVYAPFGARISGAQQAQYYGETLFTPQGALDPTQWWAEYHRLGPQGLADAIDGAAKWRRRMGLPVRLPVSQFQETPVGPTPGGVTDTTPAGGWPGATPEGQPGPGAVFPGKGQ